MVWRRLSVRRLSVRPHFLGAGYRLNRLLDILQTECVYYQWNEEEAYLFSRSKDKIKGSGP